VAALQCLCYPLLIPFLRKDVRDDKGIPVNFFFLVLDIKNLLLNKNIFLQMKIGISVERHITWLVFTVLYYDPG
jgi:hypothetical protein